MVVLLSTVQSHLALLILYTYRRERFSNFIVLYCILCWLSVGRTLWLEVSWSILTQWKRRQSCWRWRRTTCRRRVPATAPHTRTVRSILQWSSASVLPSFRSPTTTRCLAALCPVCLLALDIYSMWPEVSNQHGGGVGNLQRMVNSCLEIAT